MMAVYCLHFTMTIGGAGPRSRAGHYVGSCSDYRLEKRLAEHQRGAGAAITRHLHKVGIGFLVAAVIPGGRELEKTIKARKVAGGGICGACVPAAFERVTS
jgi:hypothetical protein